MRSNNKCEGGFQGWELEKTLGQGHNSVQRAFGVSTKLGFEQLIIPNLYWQSENLISVRHIIKLWLSADDIVLCFSVKKILTLNTFTK
jgi:hypothetical protein